MSARIFKYPIDIQHKQTVSMPDGARILCVQMQGDQPMLWALVNDDVPPEPREIHVRGTGHDATGIEHMRYIGTVQMAGAAFVFHVFESPR